mgnify:CR=1 FL=1
MLNENIRNLRKQKGLSQVELANKIHVVRQTVSKWESGLSVPDSYLLINLANELDVSVSDLLGETIKENNENDLKAISNKLEAINLKLSNLRIQRIKRIRMLLIFLCIFIITLFVLLYFMGSSYLNWDYSNNELAVAGTLLHGFEFIFVRISPIVLVLSVIGIIITYKNPEVINE